MAVGTMGIVQGPSAPWEGAALGGDLWLSPALNCQTSGRFGVPLRRACAHRDIQGMLEVAVNTFVKRRSVNTCMVKTKSLCRETASWC